MKQEGKDKMTKTIRKQTLIQFLMYAPDEIEVDTLATFIEAKAQMKKTKDQKILVQGTLCAAPRY